MRIAIDTDQAIQALVSVGFKHEQARAMIDHLTPAHDELVTKEYLRAELLEMESRIDKRFSEFESHINQRFSGINQRFSEIETKIAKSASDNVKFQLIQTIAIIATMIALTQIF